MQTYAEFIDQSVDWPQEGFEVHDDELHFHDINMMELVETYGTPLRFTYMPLISRKIKQAKLYFQNAMLQADYRGSYTYCYCTKTSHYRHVLEEVLQNDVHLETSSAFDMPIVEMLEKRGLISKQTLVVCNGFKRDNYKQNIVDLIHDGFSNIIPVLDNKEEFNFYVNELEVPCSLGIRLATEEKPDSDFYTSRLGLRADEVVDFYNHRIKPNPDFKVTLLHFFVNSGIRDTPYYWSELEKAVQVYCRLKKVNPDLHMLDIGGGLPYRDSLDFEYDYAYMINEIILRIKEICAEHDVMEPDLVTEFGSYTVAESSGVIYKVIGRKQQNDRERWLMLDGSLMTTLPDIWAMGQRYIILPINNWDAPYDRVNLGGITCDGADFYSKDAHTQVLYLPKTRKQQFVGFFHTGAYQDALSGVGGFHHCLIPTPRHVLIGRNRDESLNIDILFEEQNSKQVLKLLGF